MSLRAHSEADPASDDRGVDPVGDSFAELVARCDRLVFNTVFRLLRNREDAEDVAQEVWLRAAKSLPKLRDRNHIESWLYRISRNCALNFLAIKKNQRQASIDDDAAEAARDLTSPAIEEPEQRIASAARREQLVAALMMLPKDERNVLVLREVHGLPYADIAQVLNISSGSAAVRSFRARARFRERWASFRGVAASPFAAIAAKLRGLGGTLASSITGSSAMAGTTAASGLAATVVNGAADASALDLATRLVIAGTSVAVAFGMTANNGGSGTFAPLAGSPVVTAQSGFGGLAGAWQPVSPWPSAFVPPADGMHTLPVAPTGSMVGGAVDGASSVAVEGGARVMSPAAAPGSVNGKAPSRADGQGLVTGPGNGQAVGRQGAANGQAPAIGQGAGQPTVQGNAARNGVGAGNAPTAANAQGNLKAPGVGQATDPGNGNDHALTPGVTIARATDSGNGEGHDGTPGAPATPATDPAPAIASAAPPASPPGNASGPAAVPAIGKGPAKDR